MKKAGIAVFSLFGLLLGWVSFSQAQPLSFRISAPEFSQAPDLTVRVLDEDTLEPIEGALVTVSDRLDSRKIYLSGYAYTGSNGVESFWIDDPLPKIVTVEKEGYTRISVAGVQSSVVTIHLKKKKDEADIIATGELGGFMFEEDRRLVRAGVVLRALSAADLIHFNMDSVISPLIDTIDVYGRREIPSNIVLPRQRVRVSIINVTLDKPTYRLPLAPGKKVRLVGIQGEVPVSTLMDQMNGGSIDFAILNELKFQRVGISRELQESSNFTHSFMATRTLSPTFKVKVTKPPFQSDVIVAAVTDLDGDRKVLLPTDLKLAIHKDRPNEINQVELASVEGLGASRNIISFAVAQNGQRLSGVVADPVTGVIETGQFLDAPDFGQVNQLPETVQVQAPENGVGTLVFESKPQHLLQEGVLSREGDAVWIVHVLPAQGMLQVDTGQIAEAIHSLSTVQMDFGKGFDPHQFDAVQDLQRLSRFSKSTASW